MNRLYYEIKLGQCHLTIGKERQRKLLDKYFHRLGLDINCVRWGKDGEDQVKDAWDRLSDKDLKEMVQEIIVEMRHSDI